MSKYFIMANSKACGGKGMELAHKLDTVLAGNELVYVDATEIKDYKEFFAQNAGEDVKFLLTGGDGTLNNFVNRVDDADIPSEFYYYPSGTGNDFWADINKDGEDKPIDVRKYIVNLPTVTIKGETYKFFNGVGYGIDGYCCEVGDQMRAEGKTDINYAGIAIKGLLFNFKPANGLVTVDGVRHEYKKIWLAPIMNGRIYGGGMIPTPDQDRLGADHKLSVLVWHGSAKIPTLAAFPGIFKAQHIKRTKMCEVLTGSEITVEFDAPIAAQVDGETVLAVTKCEAKAFGK